MSNFQGGQPQRLLMSQGETRPGVRQGQHWGVPPWRWYEQMVRLNGVGPWVSASGCLIVRPTPARRPNLRLSNPVTR